MVKKSLNSLCFQNTAKSPDARAVVVAQLAEWSLPTREIRGSNPNIGKNLSVNCIILKDEKEAGICP